MLIVTSSFETMNMPHWYNYDFNRKTSLSCRWKAQNFCPQECWYHRVPRLEKKKKKRPTYTVRKKSASPQLGLLTQGTKFMYGYHIFSKSLPPLNCCSSTLKTAHHAKMKWSSLTRSPCCSRWTQEFPKPFSKVTGTHLSWEPAASEVPLSFHTC